MKNQELAYFHKGSFEPINNDFIKEGLDAMSGISKVQTKYHKPDIDTVMNELHDAIVGQYLGFQLINTEKHGMDCKLSETEDVFLESKVAAWAAQTQSATFNDTTLEKAEVFKDEKTWIALSVWNSASDLMFICFGQNEAIGDYLEKKVHAAHNTASRSTQTISLSALIFTYGFEILAISRTKEEIYTLLTSSSRTYKKLKKSIIHDYSSYTPPYLRKSGDDAL